MAERELSREVLQRLLDSVGILRFTKKGSWEHNGERVQHRGIAEYLSRHLHRSADGKGFEIRVGELSFPVKVEDTAFIVQSIDDRSIPWRVLLNHGLEEVLDPGTLIVDESSRWSLHLKERNTEARLSSVAVQRLSPYVEQEGSGFVLRTPMGVFPVRQQS